jgi:hypothetical protein
MTSPAKKWLARRSARGITTVQYALLLGVLFPACVTAAGFMYGMLYHWFRDVVFDAIDQSLP